MGKEELKITILGCAGSTGVPLIGNDWGACDPANPKNRRSRPSILVERGETILLVDTGPDMREQLLRADVRTLTGVFYTHGHSDHICGMDDLRMIGWLTKQPVQIYADAVCLADIKQRFSYIFDYKPKDKEMLAYWPDIVPNEIIGKEVTIGGLDLRVFPLIHGRIQSLGFRIGNFAYCTDVSEMTPQAWEALEGVECWIVDCTRERPHPNHAHLDRVLEWAEKLKAPRTYLTHMDQSLDYDTLCARLPRHVRPCYDGMVLEL